MMRRCLMALIFLLLFGLGAPPAGAADQPSTYVTPAELPPQLLPMPPVEGSGPWQEQIREVRQAQKHLTVTEKKAMLNEQHMRLELLTQVIGQDFTRERYPLSYAVIEKAFADCENITSDDKRFWNRRRPYLTDKHVDLGVDRIDDSPSYPSGHTSGSRVVAEVLGMLFPDRLEALRVRAEEIAFHRVEAGVHYPVDLEGGRLLAMMVMGALEKSDQFQSDIAAARDEIASQPRK